MKKLVAALLVGVCLYFVAFAPALRGSPSIGAAVQSSEYDAVRGVTTVHIVNNSHKEISALDLTFQVAFPDGTLSRAGSSSFGLDLYEGVIRGRGGFAPGATIDHEFTGQQGPVQATVDMVVYTDGTADVLNEEAFKQIIANRNGHLRGLQKVNELLSGALADQSVQHPSATVVAELEELLAAIAQQKFNENGVTGYELELESARRNIANRSQSAAGRSEREAGQLRALIESNEDQIASTLPHTRLVKAVQR
jgi:hypothetical protein